MFLLFAQIDVPANRILSIVFGIIFLAIVFFNAYRGFWRGPIRQIAPLIAFVIAGTIAWFFGPALGFSVLGKLGVPWVLRGVCGILLLGAIIWLCVFSVLWARGRKQISGQTGEPELPILGATVGCWTGGFWVMTLVLVLIFFGTLGESFLTRRKNATNSVFGKICYGAVCAKKSVALVPGFYFVKEWKLVPDSTVMRINKLVDVIASPQSRRRFFQMPEIQAIATLPSIYPVLHAPDIQAMVRGREIEALLTDARVSAMLDDEDFQRAIAEIDLEAALDYALQD